MSQPTKEQLEHEAKEKFVNDFWDNIPLEAKFKTLEAEYGNLIQEEYQEWLKEQDHD